MSIFLLNRIQKLEISRKTKLVILKIKLVIQPKKIGSVYLVKQSTFTINKLI